MKTVKVRLTNPRSIFMDRDLAHSEASASVIKGSLVITGNSASIVALTRGVSQAIAEKRLKIVKELGEINYEYPKPDYSLEDIEKMTIDERKEAGVELPSNNDEILPDLEDIQNIDVEDILEQNLEKEILTKE